MRLRTGKLERRQVRDPFFAKLMAGMAGEHTFHRLGKGAHEKLTVKDGLLGAIEVPKHDQTACSLVFFRPDPSMNGEKPVPLSAPPAKSPVETRAFILIENDQEPPTCAVVPELPPGPLHEEGMFSGALVFARADGTPLAVELIGYMMVEVYAAEGTSAAEMKAIGAAAAEEMGHQAE
jgi:hypothetical protein